VRCGGKAEGCSCGSLLEVGWSGGVMERAGAGALFGSILELGGENRGGSAWCPHGKKEGGGVQL
jgi:hypothetical protein